MAEDKDEAVYVKSTAELDLEARLADDAPDSPLLPDHQNFGSFGEFERSQGFEEGYVGTDRMYANHANDTDAPLRAEEGAFRKVEDKIGGTYLAGDQVGPNLNEGTGYEFADSDGEARGELKVPDEERAAAEKEAADKAAAEKEAADKAAQEKKDAADQAKSTPLREKRESGDKS